MRSGEVREKTCSRATNVADFGESIPGVLGGDGYGVAKPEISFVAAPEEGRLISILGDTFVWRGLRQYNIYD